MYNKTASLLPFVLHWVPKQYIENYFSWHRIDSCLALNTTVEDLSRISAKGGSDTDRRKLTLRKYDPTRRVDIWWEEEFDAVILANGHYSAPFVRIIVSKLVQTLEISKNADSINQSCLQ
jgi:cation diffusion facilitator CzcD-associated flavoprotein CzcO